MREVEEDRRRPQWARGGRGVRDYTPLEPWVPSSSLEAVQFLYWLDSPGRKFGPFCVNFLKKKSTSFLQPNRQR